MSWTIERRGRVAVVTINRSFVMVIAGL